MMYHLDIFSTLLMTVRWRIHFSGSVFECCRVVNWNYEGWRSMIMGLSSSGTFCTRAIEAADAMPCQHGWQWHAFLGWACNMAGCRAPWHEGVSCAGEGQHGVVDVRLLLWILWLGGCYCGCCCWEAAVKCRHRKLLWRWCLASWRLFVWGQAALSRL